MYLLPTEDPCASYSTRWHLNSSQTCVFIALGELWGPTMGEAMKICGGSGVFIPTIVDIELTRHIC